jgi:hypothetical protein
MSPAPLCEVHLILTPGERGSGLVFDSQCSTDELDINWQRLVLTHLREKEHKGVLTRRAITDMRITWPRARRIPSTRRAAIFARPPTAPSARGS